MNTDTSVLVEPQIMEDLEEALTNINRNHNHLINNVCNVFDELTPVAKNIKVPSKRQSIENLYQVVEPQRNMVNNILAEFMIYERIFAYIKQLLEHEFPDKIDELVRTVNNKQLSFGLQGQAKKLIRRENPSFVGIPQEARDVVTAPYTVAPHTEEQQWDGRRGGERRMRRKTRKLRRQRKI